MNSFYYTAGAKVKNPSPEGPALVHPTFRLVEPTARREGWWRWQLLPAVFRCRGSGVSNWSRSAGWEWIMNWTFFHRWWLSASTQSGFRTQDSFFTDTWNLTPETTISLDRWHSRWSLTWPKGPGFLRQNKSIEYLTSIFVIPCSIFVIRFFRVSYLIWLDARGQRRRS